jgi:hypothetical protein
LGKPSEDTIKILNSEVRELASAALTSASGKTLIDIYRQP